MSFGLVDIPVKMYSAIHEYDVRFHQPAPDGSRVHQKRVSEPQRVAYSRASSRTATVLAVAHVAHPRPLPGIATPLAIALAIRELSRVVVTVRHVAGSIFSLGVGRGRPERSRRSPHGSEVGSIAALGQPWVSSKSRRHSVGGGSNGTPRPEQTS